MKEQVHSDLTASRKKEVSSMVFILTGAAESNRNSVGKFLADSLGWEFVDAANLCLPRYLDRPSCSSTLDADPTLHIEALSAAIRLWIYEWRDVVVSSPPLTEKDRKQLAKMSSLIKIVCLDASHATARSALSAGSLGQNVLTVDSSRNVEEIIAEMTAALMM
jgi:hypothetical protein